MAPRWVRKRDGRIEPYDEARIARAVIRGGRRYGHVEEIEHLGREIARSVTLFLTKSEDRAPETSLLAHACVEALDRTGHGQIARSVQDWRNWRSKRQAEVRVREGSHADRSVEVLSLGAARPWSKQRIVHALQREAGLGLEQAEEVARAVEERVFAAGLNQISTTLLRELIDADLFERGYSAQLGKLEVLGVPKPDLERLAFLGQGRAPITLEDRVSRTALKRFALAEIVDGAGSVAHRRGDIHLTGLDRPFRMATGAVCAKTVCQTPDIPSTPIEAVRRLIRVVRGATTSYDLVFGLVGIERALAPYVDAGDALREALEVFLEALIQPIPDDVPSTPELVLVVEAPPTDSAERATLDLLINVLTQRGRKSSGVRLLLHLSELQNPAPESLLRSMIGGAATGAGLDLVLGPGVGLSSRGMRPWAGVLQVGLINLAGAALAAGRGGRDRFSNHLDEAVEAALTAFHQRRRRVFASVVRPAFPLFGELPEVTEDPSIPDSDPEALWDSLGVVGLEAAMRYLVGEGPHENPRVAELALEVLLELRAKTEHVAARLGLGQVLLEEVPVGDAGIRLAALDLERFPDAHDLLGEAEGWDISVTPGDADVMLADLRVRMWLARSTRSPLVLMRPVLAAMPEAEATIRAIERSMKTTTRSAKRVVTSR